MKVYESVPHPGTRIKAEVIPAGMSVTHAAQLIGVGRPALSNLLNGNASLSTDMAKRLEKAFNYPGKDLLDMQARYDEAQAALRGTPSNIKPYVPPFLAIKANDIERWASNNIPARARLSVFLRTLVHSTCNGLTKVDFPGNDDAERTGWDGVVETDEGTPWVPSGRSGWEFGANKNIKRKADKDFVKSVKTLNETERAEITFIFITPRRWPGKGAWIAAKKEKGYWKDVRAYDASDLEQWLEQSPSGQAWFANETGIPAQDVRSLDKCWDDWAKVSEPPLSGILFNSAIEAAKRSMLSRLSKSTDGPTYITADSTEEALAFVAQLFSEQGDEKLAAYRDRVLIFDKPGVLPRLAEGGQTFIPVAFTREVERELAPFAKSMHSIVVYPRNAITGPHIELEPAGYEMFEAGLNDMGKDRDDISRLANESGRSLTVLRRRLANVHAVRTPKWAADHNAAVSLVPFMLAGAWNSKNAADRYGLEQLAGERPYVELERECQHLTQLNDPPVWSIDALRGVISKIDLLYAISGAITLEDLERYFDVAILVLGEDDPSLDLAEDQRWAASIHGKTREFSSAFRKGISETLVLLSVHGNRLFKNRLGIDTEAKATQIVRELLPTPLTTLTLEANDLDLPTYAEAAPDEFLSILERDLGCENPAVLGLLRPAEVGPFSHPVRTGLLWALEGLSWNPESLSRAAIVLAQLAQIEINDNWVNKPINSLEGIFRARMPQTEANHEARIELMFKLKDKFPDVAWKLCVAQFSNHYQIGHYNHKPQWRTDGDGFGESLTDKVPFTEFVGQMIEMALTCKEYTLSMLNDLVECLHALSESEQNRVWEIVETWCKGKASGADKATLREEIRVSILSMRAARQARNQPKMKNLVAPAKAAYTALEPNDLLNKHAWLFRSGWVEESADEIEDIKNIDFAKRDERIKNLRAKALLEIHKQLGVDGILTLACQGETSWLIGKLSSDTVLSEGELRPLLQRALKPILDEQQNVNTYKNLIAGVLYAITDIDRRGTILKDVAAGMPEETTVQLLLLAPYGKSTWDPVDKLGEADQIKYWCEVEPDWVHGSDEGHDEENNESVDRLMKCGRPRAAFHCVQYHLEKIDAEQLYRLLSDMAQGGNEKPDQYLPDPYRITKAFEHLNSGSGLTLEQMAGLEFAYIELLTRWLGNPEDNRIPNLEKHIELHPEFFVKAVVWLYKRKDGAADPAEFQVSPELLNNPEHLKNLARRYHELLQSIRRIPGHNDLDELETGRLIKWISTVRQSCKELSRADIADICIGKVLSCSPVGKDGGWPCESVRDTLEELQSETIIRGIHTGVYNSRGVTSRKLGEGGGQERELVEKYRQWGQAILSSHPYVATKLLFGLAYTYEQDAGREDTEVEIRQRLRH